MTDVDVAVVGAGIAGSALACALSGRGLRIALLEAAPRPSADLPGGRSVDDFDTRVSALTPRSVQWLDGIGAWDAIRDYRTCAYRHMTVWDAEGTGEIEFDCAEVRAPALGHLVENRAITRSLLQRVDAADDIRFLNPVRLQTCSRLPAGGMLLETAAGSPDAGSPDAGSPDAGSPDAGSRLRAPLVIAADGAQSRLRELLGFRTREWDYGHRAIVATVEVQHPHRDTAWQRFLPSGPLAFLPLPGGHLCSIVWSMQEQRVDRLLALDQGAFCDALGEAFEHRLGRVLASSRRLAFPLRQRHAVDYVQEGAALVGDAAHTIHPLAGQGINLGLSDVAVLAEELLAAHRRGLPLGSETVLRRYQRRRKGENLAMMAAMDGFKRLFEQRALPLRWLRNAGMRGVGSLGPLKQQIMRHAMGL